MIFTPFFTITRPFTKIVFVQISVLCHIHPNTYWINSANTSIFFVASPALVASFASPASGVNIVLSFSKRK